MNSQTPWEGEQSVLASLLTTDAAADAETPAVRIGGFDTSYASLMRRAHGYAATLSSHGRVSKPRILVASQKSVDAYALELASILVGGCFCALNLDSPPGRNDAIRKDFEPDFVLDGGLLTAAGETLQVISDPLEANLDPTYDAEDAAYVMYTSGSTGAPKGVVVSYASLDWFLGSLLPILDVGPGWSWSNHPSLAFDLSILDVFGAFATRSTLVPVVAPIERAFPASFIAANGLGVWQSVPSLVETMRQLRAGEDGLLRSLERVVLCGEPCDRSWVEYLLEYCSPSVRVFNCYGPTETTVFCTVEEMRRGYEFDDGEPFAAVGSAIPGALVSLENEIDGWCEIVISGPGVGLGYNNVAVDNGYTTLGGRRSYRTGDFAETVGERTYFRGRRDSQVKVRGNRLELGEVEGRVRALFDVEAYAVLVRDDVVLFVGRDCGTEDSSILDALGDVLPTYAVPAMIRRLDAWPRNANDKVDRAALQRLNEDRSG